MTSDLAVLGGGYGLWHVTYGVTCVGKYKRKATGPAPQSTGVGGDDGRGILAEAASMDYPTFPEIK